MRNEAMILTAANDLIPMYGKSPVLKAAATLIIKRRVERYQMKIYQQIFGLQEERKPE